MPKPANVSSQICFLPVRIIGSVPEGRALNLSSVINIVPSVPINSEVSRLADDLASNSSVRVSRETSGILRQAFNAACHARDSDILTLSGNTEATSNDQPLLSSSFNIVNVPSSALPVASSKSLASNLPVASSKSLASNLPVASSKSLASNQAQAEVGRLLEIIEANVVPSSDGQLILNSNAYDSQNDRSEWWKEEASRSPDLLDAVEERLKNNSHGTSSLHLNAVEHIAGTPDVCEGTIGPHIHENVIDTGASKAVASANIIHDTPRPDATLNSVNANIAQYTVNPVITQEVMNPNDTAVAMNSHKACVQSHSLENAQLMESVQLLIKCETVEATKSASNSEHDFSGAGDKIVNDSEYVLNGVKNEFNNCTEGTSDIKCNLSSKIIEDEPITGNCDTSSINKLSAEKTKCDIYPIQLFKVQAKRGKNGEEQRVIKTSLIKTCKPRPRMKRCLQILLSIANECLVQLDGTIVQNGETEDTPSETRNETESDHLDFLAELGFDQSPSKGGSLPHLQVIENKSGRATEKTTNSVEFSNDLDMATVCQLEVVTPDCSPMKYSEGTPDCSGIEGTLWMTSTMTTPVKIDMSPHTPPSKRSRLDYTPRQPVTIAPAPGGIKESSAPVSPRLPKTKKSPRRKLINTRARPLMPKGALIVSPLKIAAASVSARARKQRSRQCLPNVTRLILPKNVAAVSQPCVKSLASQFLNLDHQQQTGDTDNISGEEDVVKETQKKTKAAHERDRLDAMLDPDLVEIDPQVTLSISYAMCCLCFVFNKYTVLILYCKIVTII